MDIISILTLIIAACTLFFSIHIYNQTYLIPKKNESLQNLINIITNKISELKVEGEESEDNILPLEYAIYISYKEEGCIDIYEKWKIPLEEFRYSSNYNFLITPAKKEFNELLSKDFYIQITSIQDLVLKLEDKREHLLKLNETIFSNSVDDLMFRFLNWISKFIKFQK